MAKKKKIIYGDRDRHNLEKDRLDHYSIVCPFCDEPSRVISETYDANDIREKKPRILVTSQKIYYPRVCAMGHTFWSVECVPDKYEQLLDEVEDIMNYSIEQLDKEDEIAEYESMKAEKRAKERQKVAQRNANKRYRKKKQAEAREQKRQAERDRKLHIEQLKDELAEKMGVDYVCFNWPIINVYKKPGEKGYHEKVGRKKRLLIKEKLKQLEDLESYFEAKMEEYDKKNKPVAEEDSPEI